MIRVENLELLDSNPSVKAMRWGHEIDVWGFVAVFTPNICRGSFHPLVLFCGGAKFPALQTVFGNFYLCKLCLTMLQIERNIPFVKIG